MADGGGHHLDLFFGFLSLPSLLSPGSRVDSGPLGAALGTSQRQIQTVTRSWDHTGISLECSMASDPESCYGLLWFSGHPIGQLDIDTSVY